MANEKRLIDANAFKMFLENVRQDYLEEDTLSSDFAAKVIETVQDEYLALAPTVDAVEVVHARWRWGYNSMNQYGAWCAECECGWEDKGTDDDFIRVQGLVIAHKYCPNCGAKMDGGNKDA